MSGSQAGWGILAVSGLEGTVHKAGPTLAKHLLIQPGFYQEALSVGFSLILRF